MLTLKINTSTLNIPEKGDTSTAKIYNIHFMANNGQYYFKVSLNYVTSNSSPEPTTFSNLVTRLNMDGYNSAANMYPCCGMGDSSDERIVGVYSNNVSLYIIYITATISNFSNTYNMTKNWSGSYYYKVTSLII